MYLNLIHEDLVSSVRLLMNKVQLFCGIHLFFIKAAVSANLSFGRSFNNPWWQHEDGTAVS